jgi:CRP-like cAMP-binding protein
MDALTFLSGHVPLFEGVSAEELTELAVNSVLRQYAAGKVVIYSGMTVEGLHVVATGKVEVHVKVPGKSGTQRVADLGPGDVFGEVSMVEKTMSAAAVKAGPEGAYVLVIPEEPFRRLVESNAAFGARVRELIQARRSAPAPKP